MPARKRPRAVAARLIRRWRRRTAAAAASLTASSRGCVAWVGPPKECLCEDICHLTPMSFDSQMMLWGECDQNTKALCSVHMMSISLLGSSHCI